MDNKLETIKSLLQDKADLQARLNLIPYDGSPEVKENSSGKYLYIRKRVNGKLTSTYVDVYSDNLYQLLLRNAREARELKKSIRKIDKQLAEVGYSPTELSGGELTAEVTADYLRREHLPDRAFSSEKARYHRPAGTMPEEGVVIQRRYNKSQAA